MPFALEWSSTGIDASSMVQITIVNIATGARSPIAVRKNTGSFAFIPSAAVGTGAFFFELSASLDGRTVSSASPNVLLETPPAYLLLRIPDGRTAYATGDSMPIRWDSGNLASRTVALRLVRSDGTVVVIAENAANTGTYAYTIGAGVKSGDYAVEVKKKPFETKLSFATRSAACDGAPASSFSWLEVGSPDPKRPALLSSSGALKTTVQRLRVGTTTIQLSVRDRLGQESRTTVAIKVTNRKIVTVVVCLDASAESFAATFNETTVLPPLAAALSEFLQRPLPVASFAQLRAVLCPEGGSAAVSAQVPAVVGRTGSEIAAELSRMAPSDFPNGALQIGGARRRLFAASAGSVPVTRLFVSATPSTLNAPPSTPQLAIIPASRYFYIVVNPQTKLGAVQIVASASDTAPGVLASWEWYVEGQQQASTGDSLSLSLKVGTYRVHAVALDDENLDSMSEPLTLFVVDEYSCNVGKASDAQFALRLACMNLIATCFAQDLVLVLDAATSAASQTLVNDFLLKFLRPFWIQGPDSFVSVVRYSLPPSGNASVALPKSEVKAAYDALASRAIDGSVNPSTPRLMARGVDAGRAAAESMARKGVVRSIVLVAFDEPLDGREALNASAPARLRSNLYAVPAIADAYAFESGFDLFRNIPNTTNVLPVTLELQEEVQRAAINLAKAVCEGQAPPGADDFDVGKSIGQAITVAVAAAIGVSAAGALGGSVGASMGGGAGASAGAGGGAFGIISQAQFISETSFLSMNLPGTYNSTSTSTQWTMLYFGSPGWRGGGGGGGGGPNSATTGSSTRGRRLLGLNAFTREMGGEIASPFLEESIFYSGVLIVGVTVIEIIVTLLATRVFHVKETPKLFWFPKPQVAVIIVAYEGFVLASAATARLTDTFWRTVGAILLTGIAGTFFVFAVLVVVYRLKRSHIEWWAGLALKDYVAIDSARRVPLEKPDWRQLWAMSGEDDLERPGAFKDELNQIKHAQEELHRKRNEAELLEDAESNAKQVRSRGPELAQAKLPHTDAGKQPHSLGAGRPHANLELFEAKPMDEYSRTKRWAGARWAAAKDAWRTGRKNFARSVHRRRLSLLWRWINWERGVWIVNPNRSDRPRTFWTFDVFFEPFRGDNFGQWFGIWDIFRKLASGLVVGLVNDPSPDPALGPALFFTVLQVKLVSRAAYRRAVLAARGQAALGKFAPSSRDGELELESGGTKPRAGADLGAEVQPNLLHILFSAGVRSIRFFIDLIL
eukprot:tig00021282_g19948.t1